MKQRLLAQYCFLLVLLAPYFSAAQSPLANPVMFVTIQPGDDFSYQLQTFGNHEASSWGAAPRGSDLWIQYPDGSKRNLTREAGFGKDDASIQGDGAIGVRQPTVHWDGKKALFSMVIGGPKAPFDVTFAKNKWQLYEITGLGKNETAVITKIPGQPNYNNLSPIYTSDNQILFTSDAPLFGMSHTYPQLDEYESAPTVTGIWKLEPATTKLTMIEHAPSGVFDLFEDSFGRILFTKWDHLKRDQQADLDRYEGQKYNPVDFENESASAKTKVYPQTVNGKPFADSKGVLYDIFPEARHEQDPTRDPDEALHDFNQFMIWEINEDGSDEEVINHAGRDEFGGTFMFGSKTNDPNLDYAFTNHSKNSIRSTFGPDAGLFQVKENPSKPGTYYAAYSLEFSRLASGRIIQFDLPPGKNPEEMNMVDWTNDKLDNDPYGEKPATANMTGHYRNPLMMSNGTMLVSHTPEYRLNETGKDASENPYVLYTFRIKKMTKRFPANASSTEHIATDPLTGTGISRTLKYYDNGTLETWTGIMSEVDVVEVVARTRPVSRKTKLEPVEKEVLDEEGVDEAALRKWLTDNNMALIVSRDMTQRDRADVHQPFNLRVPGGVSSIAKSGKVYDIVNFQIFQADLLRAYKDYDGKKVENGRRVYANTLHNTAQHPEVESMNVKNPAGPQGSVKIGLDGSMAAFVPAGRALSWQTTDGAGKGIVRERNWLSFAPGEIRTCAGCHGLNSKSQTGKGTPQNKPEAFRSLLQQWKNFGDNVVLGTPGEVVSQSVKNFPNPFHSTTTIQYELPRATQVSLTIYDALGREMKTLVNERQEQGAHGVVWNGVNENGTMARPGLHTYVLRTGNKVSTGKMLFIR